MHRQLTVTYVEQERTNRNWSRLSCSPKILVPDNIIIMNGDMPLISIPLSIQSLTKTFFHDATIIFCYRLSRRPFSHRSMVSVVTSNDHKVQLLNQMIL